MAVSNTPTIIPKLAQDGIIQFHLQAYQMLGMQWNFRENMRQVDLAYIREADWTAEHRSKTYIVTTPNGEELTVTNLSAFAREHGLSQGTLRGTAVGQRQFHKGYSCRFAA